MNRRFCFSAMVACLVGCHQFSHQEVLLLHAGGDIELAYRALKAGLPATERWRVNLTGTTLMVHLHGTSMSLTLSLLRRIKAETRHHVRVVVADPGTPFDCLVASVFGDEIVLRDFSHVYKVKNYVRAIPEGVLGQTLIPLSLPLVVDKLYSLRQFELYIAKDQPFVEVAATVYHELAHILFEGHPPELLKIEDDARRNAAT